MKPPQMRFSLHSIRPEFDDGIANIIRQGGIEYGATGEGFGPSDAEVGAMSQHYQPELGSLYRVATIAGQVVGGCGVAPFNGSNKICELRKLFLLPSSRGLGIGKALALECLAFARDQSYQQCYLDTLTSMTAAIALYRSLGFEHLNQPLNGTLHGGCDVWMLKQLAVK